VGPGRGTLRGTGTSGRGVWATSDGGIQREKVIRMPLRFRRKDEQVMGSGNRMIRRPPGINDGEGGCQHVPDVGKRIRGSRPEVGCRCNA